MTNYSNNGIDLSTIFTLATPVPNTTYTTTGYSRMYNGTKYDLGQIYKNFPTTTPPFNNRLTHNTQYISKVNGIAYDIGKILLNTRTVFGTSIQDGTGGVVNAMALDSNDNLYVGGLFTTVSSNQGTISANNIAMWNGTWNPLGLPSSNGTNGVVYAIDIDVNNIVYVGGNFTSISDGYIYKIEYTRTLTANNIASWIPEGDFYWSLLGTDAGNPAGTLVYNGTNGIVRTIAINNSLNRVYVGGDNITTCYDSRTSGLGVKNICYWDPFLQLWSKIGGTNSGVDGIVRAIKIDTNSDLYVGGLFNVNFSTKNIAIWHTFAEDSPFNRANEWSSLGSKTNGVSNNGVFTTAYIYAITMDKLGNIYIGGLFNSVNIEHAKYMTANNIAMWNGRFWRPLGTESDNGTNGTVYTIEVDSNNNVYVGGEFTKIGYNTTTTTGGSANRIAIWNGSWSACGTDNSNGVGGAVYTIKIDPNNNVYVGGSFTTASSENQSNFLLNNIAYWNNSNSNKRWFALGTINDATKNGVTNGNVRAIDISGTNIYVGGTFTQVNSSSQLKNLANKIAYWNGSMWVGLGATLLTTATNNGVGGGTETVHCIKIKGTDVYVGGTFYEVYAVVSGSNTKYLVNYIAKWNGTWNALGSTISTTATNNGISNTVASRFVRSIEIDSANNVYVGGLFRQAKSTAEGTLSVSNVAVFSNSTLSWSTLGAGVGGTDPPVATIKLINSKFYVGGRFISASMDNIASVGKINVANNMAVWDGSSWSTFGGFLYSSSNPTVYTRNGINGQCNTIEIINNDVYVGGVFDTVIDNLSNTTSYSMAKWNKNTFTWSSIISSTNVSHITVIKKDNNNRLYVGGYPTIVNGVTVNGIFVWNNSSIVTSGTGVSNMTTSGIIDITTRLGVRDILITSTNVCIGGKFNQYNQRNASNIIQISPY